MSHMGHATQMWAICVFHRNLNVLLYMDDISAGDNIIMNKKKHKNNALRLNVAGLKLFVITFV